jgi:hypothetical protein
VSLYVYAVLAAAPAGPLGVGLAGEPMRTVVCDAACVAISTMAAAPAVSPDVLRGHDTVVRRLAELVDAVLPARFGTILPDERAICERLDASADELRTALARVAGREQMILRIYSERARTAPEGTSVEATSGGPGARYLAERARAHHATTAVTELEALRPALARFVVAERVERHATPPLVASVYHLVRRGDAVPYAAAIEEATHTLVDVRVRVSGPWAPYAFAPDTLR